MASLRNGVEDQLTSASPIKFAAAKSLDASSFSFYSSASHNRLSQSVLEKPKIPDLTQNTHSAWNERGWKLTLDSLCQPSPPPSFVPFRLPLLTASFFFLITSLRALHFAGDTKKHKEGEKPLGIPRKGAVLIVVE